MTALLLDAAGRRRSPATMPGFRAGRATVRDPYARGLPRRERSGLDLRSRCSSGGALDA